jgi:protease YdgD
MLRLLSTFALLLGWSAGALADNGGLRPLLTGDDSRGWEAVGRLELGGIGFCTGALIAENLVLTAGHCLFNRYTGARIAESEITFLAGWRGGRASAYRNVRRAVLHPDFVYASETGEMRVRNDLALLELDQPIRTGSIIPFETRGHPAKGAEVAVVSYAHDRAESPSLQELCHVLARQSGALVLSCAADFGSSGAPVFVAEGGVARIVSVISAKAMAGNRQVSLGTSLEEPLKEMLAILATSDGVFTRAEPRVRVMSQSQAQGQTGAKFIRP